MDKGICRCRFVAELGAGLKMEDASVVGKLVKYRFCFD